MKLCINCKHFTPDTLNWDIKDLQIKYAVCALTSKVTGFDGEECRSRRNVVRWFVPYCGPQGKQWEAA